MHAHARMPQEPWTYGQPVMDLYRGYVLLHEQLVPYIRAAALTAARTGVPIMRPLCLLDPADARGWSLGDAYGGAYAFGAIGTIALLSSVALLGAAALRLRRNLAPLSVKG